VQIPFALGQLTFRTEIYSSIKDVKLEHVVLHCNGACCQ